MLARRLLRAHAMNRQTLVPLALFFLACGQEEGVLTHEQEKTGQTSDALKVCAAGPTVKGIDVSYYQGTIDWQAVASSGVAFAITRLNDGSYHDPQFERNWSEIKAKGLVRGAYQFFEPNDDATWQANLVVNAVGRLGSDDLPVMLDVEWTAGTPNAAELSTWLHVVEAGTGKKPMIYTAVGYWNQYFNGQFGDYPLVVANYGVSCPNLPNSWSGWNFWQWGGAGVPGIAGNVDQNVFNGTLEQLHAFAGGGGGGGDMLEPNVAVGTNLDGRLEVFARAGQQQIVHSWQGGTHGGWSSWADLGGTLGGEPVAARNQDGRLELFAVGSDGHGYHQWQTAPNGGWSGWWPLGGTLRPGLAVGTNPDGRLELFGIGSDGQLWHQWQKAPNGGWSGWWPMGGQVLDAMAVENNADGRLEVFVRGMDRQLWHQWQQPNGGWSGFWPMAGQFASDPAVARNADGRLEVFGVGADGQVWHGWQVAPNGGWSGFFPLGGSAGSVPTVGHNQDGRLEVFVRGSDGKLYHSWQSANGPGGWSGFWPLGDIPVFSAPSVSRNADGRLEVFVRGGFGAVFHVWQTAPNAGWSAWYVLGG